MLKHSLNFQIYISPHLLPWYLSQINFSTETTLARLVDLLTFKPRLLKCGQDIDLWRFSIYCCFEWSLVDYCSVMLRLDGDWLESLCVNHQYSASFSSLLPPPWNALCRNSRIHESPYITWYLFRTILILQKIWLSKLTTLSLFCILGLLFTQGSTPRQ